MPFVLRRTRTIRLLSGSFIIFLILLLTSDQSMPGPRIASTRSDDDPEIAGNEYISGEMELFLYKETIVLGKGILREPLGLDVSPTGEIFVADAMTGKIFIFAPDGAVVEFEDPPLGSSIYPIDLAVNGTFVYVLDYSDNRLLRYDRNGTFLDVLISFGLYDRMRPSSVSGGGGGRLLTTDMKNHGLTIWTPLLDIEFLWNEFGFMEGALDRPAKAVLLLDERIAVAETGNKRVQIFSPSGRYESILVLPDDTGFEKPRSICVGRDGNIHVADTDAGAVFIFSPDLSFLGKIDSFGGMKISPSAVAVGWNGGLYIADIRSGSILVMKRVDSVDE
ncbi:MAG: NHL repeat-containing protein [Bacteroidales bacterium]|nr:NHL repeat-containing protein [Candidatus Latescibacterota bacterium]